MARQLITITVNGKEAGQEFISEEFADGIAKYNFKDFDEVNMVLQTEHRCRVKDVFDWCPADTKNLKKYLGMEV